MAGDLASGAICCNLISDSTSESVISGLKTLALRYRLPSKILTDSGPSFKSLLSNPSLLQALSSMNIEIVLLPGHHQFANWVERSIQECKKIFASMKEDTSKSLYNQPQSVEELIGKLYAIEAAVNSRPYLVSTNDSSTTVLTPKQLLSPWMSGEEVSSWVEQVLCDTFNPNTTISLLGRTSGNCKEVLQEAIHDYLMSAGLRFNKDRMGNLSKN